MAAPPGLVKGGDGGKNAFFVQDEGFKVHSRHQSIMTLAKLTKLILGPVYTIPFSYENGMEMLSYENSIV